MGIGAPKKHTTASKGKRYKHNIKIASLKSIRQDCFRPKEGQSSTQSASDNLVQVSSQSLDPTSQHSTTSSEILITKTKLKLDTSPPELVKNLILWALNVVSKRY